MAYCNAKITLDFDVDELLERIDIDDVVKHYGTGPLLTEIGQEEAEGHFGLVPAEEE